MRLFAISIFIAILITPAFSKGRDSLFEHLAPRSKLCGDRNHSVTFTGDEEGLGLQVSRRLEVTFPDGRSYAVDPGGKKIGLEITKSQERDVILNWWDAKFTADHLMNKGIYKYVVVVLINGREYDLSHEINYSFKPFTPHLSKSTQTEPKK